MLLIYLHVVHEVLSRVSLPHILWLPKKQLTFKRPELMDWPVEYFTVYASLSHCVLDVVPGKVCYQASLNIVMRTAAVGETKPFASDS